jgi:hypothetical protein
MIWSDGWLHTGGSWMGLVLLFAFVATLVAAFVGVWVRDHGSATRDTRAQPPKPISLPSGSR